MTEKRYDIVIVDRIDQNIDKALEQLIQKSKTLENSHTRLTNAMKKNADTQNRLTVSTNKMSNEDLKAATNREKLRKLTAQADTAEERLALAKQRTKKATIDVTAAEVRLQKARSSVNRQSAVVISKNGEVAASNKRVAASNQLVADSAQLASRRYKATTAAARQQTAQTSNLIFQLQDVVVGLQGGQKPLTVLLQQGAQIQGAFGPGTGVLGIFRGLARAAGVMVRPFLPFVGVLGVGAVAAELLGKNINKSTGEAVTFGDTGKAVFQVAGGALNDHLIKPAKELLGPAFTFAYGTIIKGTPVVVNGVVRTFTGGYNAIVTTWALLPVAMDSVIKLGANKTIEGVDALVNGVLLKINNLIVQAAVLATQFNIPVPEDIGLIKSVNLEKFKIALTDKDKGVAAIIKDAFNSTKNIDYAGDLFDKIADKAVDNARKRIEKTISGLGKNDTSETEKLRQSNAALKANIGVYGDYGRALTFANKKAELLNEAKKKKIKTSKTLTDTVNRMAGAYADAFAEFEKTKAFKAEIDNINQPLNDHLKIQDLLSLALSQNAISQGQYNEALANSGLVQNLDNVRASLLGTTTAYQQAINDIGLSKTIATNIVEDAVKASLISIDEKVSILKSLEQKALTDTKAANDNRTQPLRDFDRSLGGVFGDNAEIEQLKIQQSNQLEQLRQFREQKLLTQSEYDLREIELTRQTNQQITNIENARKNLVLTSAISIGDSLANITGNIAGEQSKAYKVMFAASKAFAIADSIIKIQQGIANAMALPFPANLAAAGVVASQAASIVANIKSVSDNGFRTGGFTGNGGVSGVAGVVHNREFVIDAPTTAANRPALDTLQRTGSLPTNTPSLPKLEQNITNRFELINETGVPMLMEYMDENRVRLIAEQVADKQIKTKTPEILQGELAQPNSKTSKALSTFTTTARKHG